VSSAAAPATEATPRWTLARRDRARALLGWAAALAGYLISRHFYDGLGLEMDLSPLQYFWQYQDLVELRERPLEAVFYQHTQPPLYNLFLAAAIASGDASSFLEHASELFGLALHGGLYALLVGLGVRRPIAVLAIWVAAFEPASVLMETWVFYTYPVAALLVVAAALLVHGLRGGSRWALFGAFLAMATVVLTRSLFHLGWMVVAIGIAVALGRARRRTLLMAALPLTLAASVYVKNWVVFGRPVASTWLGFSLSRLTTTKLPTRALEALEEEGAVSELADHLPWLPLTSYPSAWRALPPGLPDDVAVLTEPTRTTGYPNFNHGAYIGIARTFREDAEVVLARRPDVWWESTRRAWRLYFLPIHDYTFFHAARQRAGPRMREIERIYERAYGADAFAEWSWDEPMPPLRLRPGWRWAWLLGVALLVGLGVVLRDPRRERRATVAFLIWTVVVVGLVGNSLELGENNRFRFLAQPLSWALLALALDRALSGLARLAGRRAA
jgi:hypothetical protein